MSGEFDLIAKLFAPLAQGEAGTFGLKNDAAALSPGRGGLLVMTADALVEGVHFFPDDPPREIARKLLRTNLSDLAAMGARPRGYLMTMALPLKCREDWLEDFVIGLTHDQEVFDVFLWGGDTTRTSGPLCLSLTAVGELAPGQEALTRSGGQAGDLLCVTGTIEDAALGLKMQTGDLLVEDEVSAALLLRRYWRPQPRTIFGVALPGLATACLDVSDGLAADAAHMADESDLQAVIHLDKVPLSRAVKSIIDTRPQEMETVICGGDDYELLFSVPEEHFSRLSMQAQVRGLEITPIGSLKTRDESSPHVLLLDGEGQPYEIASTGWTHF